MKVTVATRLPARMKNGLLVVCAYADGLATEAEAVDGASQGAIGRARKRGDLTGQSGEAVTLYELDGVVAERVLVVGAGERGRLDVAAYRTLVATLAERLADTPARQLYLSVARDLSIDGVDAGWRHETLLRALLDARYRFTRHKSDTPKANAAPAKVVLLTDDDERPAARRAVMRALAIDEGMRLARDLGNAPPNLCTPEYLAETGRAMAREHASLKARVLDEKQMHRLGMGAFLSVAAGSRQPPRLIALEYRGGAKQAAPIALVGKGVTFDTGGISIKPSATLDEMKFDMCGAACVLGTMEVVCRLGLPLNVIGVIAAAENMPDGNATRPADIVRSLSGQTIEILNTDAEGRMLLADSLSWVERYQPETVIDIATLTGAAVISLGNVMSALFANDDELAQALLQAGDTAGDPAWRMPLDDRYQTQLDSPFADMANIGGRAAGAVTAACFLSRFVGERRWAHLDIAGVASKGGAEKGATGRCVPLLVQYLVGRAGTAR